MSTQPIRSLMMGALPLITILGCEGAGSSGSTDHMLIRDSAGTRIVENLAHRLPGSAGWRLSEAPVLQIGTVDDDLGLYELVGVA